jgi:deoxyribodipyrimidine photo-lyase
MSSSFLPFRRQVAASEPIDRYRLRVSRCGGAENPGGEFVLYWSQSARRMCRNLALDHAIEQANRLSLPVVVYEALRPDYPYANDRIHRFVLEGVATNRADAVARGLRYHFFLPRTTADARGTVRALSSRAALVVTDEYPTFVVKEQTARFVARAGVAVHLVDGNGILPMRAFAKEQYSAKFLRDRAHRMFPDFWTRFDDIRPLASPFSGDLSLEDWCGEPADAVLECAIDHSVPAAAAQGGRAAGLTRLEAFVSDGLEGYATKRNRSPKHTSGLSPYLHFGHLGIHEIAERVLLSDAPLEDIDSFLEEAIIRRELSFNLCFFRKDHDSLTALPDWAKKTLHKHRGDRRKPLYTAAELEAAGTGDEVWNMAQQQLLDTGTMHGYLRMLWGKKVIEWMETPEEAHAFLIEQHAKYALDGRDPNTHAGVLWCFGKHDRPWAPERPIFGMIRYMSSASTAKKVRLKEIVAR